MAATAGRPCFATYMNAQAGVVDQGSNEKSRRSVTLTRCEVGCPSLSSIRNTYPKSALVCSVSR